MHLPRVLDLVVCLATVGAVSDGKHAVVKLLAAQRVVEDAALVELGTNKLEPVGPMANSLTWNADLSASMATDTGPLLRAGTMPASPGTSVKPVMVTAGVQLALHRPTRPDEEM